ncbi:tyrosine-type recombinase/integrase [Ruegeria atlantica]|uniref:Site-specific tyrosine recombinase XerD n=1 Tax=Ruegeria atlantica TaxID=81569 RepID=A0A0P1E9M5_9RHOB|nr:tyrosine-type recombinase/integrase [Ruegeria atlantica]CUH45958.1 site-specific tyrosine recombinase XerD [Ruegeria atlantica]
MLIKHALAAYTTDHLDQLKHGRERLLQLQRLLQDFQSKPVDQITNPDLTNALARWKTSTRNRYRSACTHFWRYCRAQGWADLDPTLMGAKESPRDQVLSLDQLRMLYSVADYQGAAWSQFLRLLILTGQRPSDLRQFNPALVQDQTMIIPTSKNGTSHAIPLAPRAFVLAGMMPNQFSDFATMAHVKKRWFADAYVPVRQFQIRDIRRSFASHLCDYGADENDVDRLLNHQAAATSRGVARVYNRARRMRQKRDIMCLWEGLSFKGT